MQVLNEANKLAATNLQNHISVNLFSRTRRWLALKVLSWQDPYIVGLPNRQFQSWLTLLLRASTNADNQASVAHLLLDSPVYSFRHQMCYIDCRVLLMLSASVWDPCQPQPRRCRTTMHFTCLGYTRCCMISVGAMDSFNISTHSCSSN